MATDEDWLYFDTDDHFHFPYQITTRTLCP
jgi:hypothetical protein